MSKSKIQALLTGAAMAAGLALAGPSSADQGASAADFKITEQVVNIDGFDVGQYTVFNNSVDWFIYAFAVTNPMVGAQASTTREAWAADTFCTGSFCGDGFRNLGFVDLVGYGFAYFDQAYSPGSSFGNPIGPGQFSSQFTFYAAPASDWQINVFNQGGSRDVVFGSVGDPVPEPATWGLMIAGFGLAGAALRRRRNAHA